MILFILPYFLLHSCLPLMRKNLTREVLPKHYDLYVQPEKDSFSGSVQMHLSSIDLVNSFKFNSKDLKLSHLTIVKDDTIIPCSITQDSDFVTVSLESKIKGEFTLSVQYTGLYSLSMEGFYKSSYNGKDLYSTQFEATDARRSFPCFDQPDMKATFDISIKVLEGTIALSNSSVKEIKDDLYIFNTTPLMSTYILAWVIGDLDYIEDTSLFPIRVYADKSEKHWGQFALDVTVRCISYFEKYFGIKYPLPKLDLIGIPSFAPGAMENWGLITFRKTAILFDESSTPIRSKKSIANTVCHELAHMWFGNLVTMEWWTDLWLNESFATWAASLAISNSIQDIFPSETWANFVNDAIESGMSIDSIKCTHKIGSEVTDPTVGGQVHGEIVYNKGATVIRMVERWLGSETFRLGLVHYLNKFKYQNAVTNDLWDSLSYIANLSKSKEPLDVVSVIDPWIQRDGFPYIIVEDNGTKIKLTQKRFTLGYEKDDDVWPVPINILWLGDSEIRTTHLLTERSMEINKISSFYKINDEFSGFYRVLYPNLHAQKLLKYDLSAENKANLFSDMFALALANRIPMQQALDLLDNLTFETNYNVLQIALEKLLFLKKVFYDDNTKFNFFNQKIAEIVDFRFSKINLKEFPTNINTVFTNSLVVSYCVESGCENAINELKSADLAKINPEYMKPYFQARIDDDFNKIYQLYKNSKKPAEKQNALLAIGKTNIEENIDFIFSNLTDIDPQDMGTLFASLGSNLTFRTKIVSFFISNFDKISKHANNPGITRNCLSHTLLGYYSNDSKVEKFLESFKNDREMDTAVNKVLNYIEIVKNIKKACSEVDFN